MILLAVAVAAAAAIATTVATGPATAQGSALDQYCSLSAAQANQYGDCAETEITILPLPEPIDEIPDQTILPVDVADGDTANVEVTGIVSLVDDGSAIAVRPEAVNLVSEEAVSEEAVSGGAAGGEAAAQEAGSRKMTASESSSVADAAVAAEVETAAPEKTSVEPLPNTGGPDAWLAALVGSGILVLLFGVLLFRRSSFGS